MSLIFPLSFAELGLNSEVNTANGPEGDKGQKDVKNMVAILNKLICDGKFFANWAQIYFYHFQRLIFQVFRFTMQSQFGQISNPES